MSISFDSPPSVLHDLESNDALVWEAATVQLDLGIQRSAVEALGAHDTATLRRTLMDTVRATADWAAQIKVVSEFGDCGPRDRARSISRLADLAASEARWTAFHMSESFGRGNDEVRGEVLVGFADVRTAVGDTLDALRLPR